MTATSRPEAVSPPDRAAAAATDPPVCYHGGAFFDRIGVDFRTLGRRHEIINADVLDAWFPPSPGVIRALETHLDWLLRTSPPTQCEGLIDAIAGARGIPVDSIVPGAGSSDLIFRMFTRWLDAGSTVLILDPMYGEYVHVLEHVIGCRVVRHALESSDDYRLDLEALGESIRRLRPDLVVLVNPNNPTGQHVRRADLEAFLGRMPRTTRFWIDEAYLDYVGAAESVERFAATSPNVVVCKSMSKVYALSGARAAYLCAGKPIAAEARRLTPPWVVGLAAQVASVFALRDPGYYERRYRQTHLLRRELADNLDRLGLSTLEGSANSILCALPEDAPTAKSVVAAAREHDVFIRDIASMTTRSTRRVFRVAVKTARENHRIVEALRRIMSRPPELTADLT